MFGDINKETTNISYTPYLFLQHAPFLDACLGTGGAVVHTSKPPIRFTWRGIKRVKNYEVPVLPGGDGG